MELKFYIAYTELYKVGILNHMITALVYEKDFDFLLNNKQTSLFCVTFKIDFSNNLSKKGMYQFRHLKVMA